MRIGQPLNRIGNESEVNQCTIYITVNVSRKEGAEYDIDRAGDGWRVEDQNEQCAQKRRKLVDQPGNYKRQYIAARPGYNRKHKGVLQCCKKHVIPCEETDVILEANPSCRFKNIVISKAVKRRSQHRQNRKGDEHRRVWQQKRIGNTVMPQLFAHIRKSAR